MSLDQSKCGKQKEGFDAYCVKKPGHGGPCVPKPYPWWVEKGLVNEG